MTHDQTSVAPESSPDGKAPVRGSYSAIFILFDKHDNASQTTVTTETEEQMDEAIARYSSTFQRLPNLSYEFILLYKPTLR